MYDTNSSWNYETRRKFSPTIHPTERTQYIWIFWSKAVTNEVDQIHAQYCLQPIDILEFIEEEKSKAMEELVFFTHKKTKQ